MVHAGTLTAQIADDGIGGATALPSSRLRGLTERLTVQSPQGGGTTIRARITPATARIQRTPSHLRVSPEPFVGCPAGDPAVLIFVLWASDLDAGETMPSARSGSA